MSKLTLIDEIISEMLYIWERLPKTKDGKVHYLKADIPFLYQSGFVDSRIYTLEEWLEVLKQRQQEDGSYLVDKDFFIALGYFRPIPEGKPFDPKKIPEGEWPDNKLFVMYKLRFEKQSSLTEDQFWKVVKALKKKGFEKNGHLYINDEVKKYFVEIFKKYISPRRKLLQVNQKIEEIQEKVEGYLSTSGQKESLFQAGKKRSQSKLEEFKKFESKQEIKEEKVDESKTVDIKKLRKPSKKIGV